MSVFFVGMNVVTTMIFLIIGELLSYYDKINKIKNNIDNYIPPDKLEQLLIEINDN